MILHELNGHLKSQEEEDSFVCKTFDLCTFHFHSPNEKRESGKYAFNPRRTPSLINQHHQVQLFLVKQTISFLTIWFASTRSVNFGTPSSCPAKNHPVSDMQSAGLIFVMSVNQSTKALVRTIDEVVR
jgi:hypothetical protein